MAVVIQCCQNPPKLDANSGRGFVVDNFGGLKAYITGNPNSSKAILLSTDIYGFEAPNLRKLADKVADSGFFVVAPDFLFGDYYSSDVPFDTWMKSHPAGEAVDYAKPVIAALKSRGTTVIGAAGFCWGAKCVADLAKTGELKAAVILHPAYVTVDDMKEVKCNFEILGAELDNISPPPVVKQFEAVLSARTDIHSFVKIFSGVQHGWSLRYNDNDKFAVEKAEEARKDMLNWFLSYVKLGNERLYIAIFAAFIVIATLLLLASFRFHEFK